MLLHKKHTQVFWTYAQRRRASEVKIGAGVCTYAPCGKNVKPESFMAAIIVPSIRFAPTEGLERDVGGVLIVLKNEERKR